MNKNKKDNTNQQDQNLYEGCPITVGISMLLIMTVKTSRPKLVQILSARNLSKGSERKHFLLKYQL